MAGILAGDRPIRPNPTHPRSRQPEPRPTFPNRLVTPSRSDHKRCRYRRHAPLGSPSGACAHLPPLGRTAVALGHPPGGEVPGGGLRFEAGDQPPATPINHVSPVIFQGPMPAFLNKTVLGLPGSRSFGPKVTPRRESHAVIPEMVLSWVNDHPRGWPSGAVASGACLLKAHP